MRFPLVGGFFGGFGTGDVFVGLGGGETPASPGDGVEGGLEADGGVEADGGGLAVSGTTGGAVRFPATGDSVLDTGCGGARLPAGCF